VANNWYEYCTTILPIQLLIGTCILHLHEREYVILRVSGMIVLPEYARTRVRGELQEFPEQRAEYSALIVQCGKGWRPWYLEWGLSKCTDS
jgi:hypothetical protein